MFYELISNYQPDHSLFSKESMYRSGTHSKEFMNRFMESQRSDHKGETPQIEIRDEATKLFPTEADLTTSWMGQESKTVILTEEDRQRLRRRF